MFENVDGRTDDGRTTDAGVTGILIAHLGAFGSGELKTGESGIKDDRSKLPLVAILQACSYTARASIFWQYYHNITATGM